MSRIDDALEALRAGRPIVMPTDTVYGIAALFDAPGAVAAVFAAKNRPFDRPLPVLGDGVAALRKVATFDARAEALAERFWPGPLTVVLPRAAGFDVDLGGDATDSVAVRVPRHDIALELLRRSGPLAVSSANRSDEAPALTLDGARDALGGTVACYVDGGRLSGRPSTIVSLMGELSPIRDGEVAFADVQSSMP
ncbi:MAG: L-threonylcarbamoyladenylate synthase [Actinomycetota bacterium]|nr:L-threonylcarbamoyladenylate synthase [Actinomycetota bacterium]